MGYTSITPRTTLPDPNELPTGYLPISGADVDVYINLTTGSGTATLIHMGPGGIWSPYGPSWTVNSSEKGPPGRFILPKNVKWNYHVMFTGATADSVYLVPVVR